MNVIVEHEDGSQTSYFGVQDFAATDGEIEMHFPRSADFASVTPPVHISGTVDRVVEEEAYNEQGAYETMGAIGQDDGHVVVIETGRNQAVVQAAERLVAETITGEFSGTITLAGQ